MKTFLDGIAYIIVGVASLGTGVILGITLFVGILNTPLLIVAPALLAVIVWAILRVLNDRK